MEWYQMISFLLTNELRMVLGIYLVAKLTGLAVERRLILVSMIGGGVVTFLQALFLPTFGVMAVELLIMTTISFYYAKKKLKLCLFLTFFYEVGVGLWDFLFSTVLGILFHSKDFINIEAPEYLVGIWVVRMLMLCIAIDFTKKEKKSDEAMRLASICVVLGLFGTIALSEQTILKLDEDQIGTWIILSMVLMFAIIVYRTNRQHEMELEIVSLKQEHAEILERNYQTLRSTYADNAKLYHDVHNHIETIYQCLSRGDIKEAVRYCEDLRIPYREITQTVWTGDKAIDYLISSKIAIAEQENIRTSVNIEYPSNTNIRSVDMTTILGNLLDNALEAAKRAPDNLRFLSLTIRRINAMLIIKVENGCDKAPIRENGALLTSKNDKNFHGWGIKSVQSSANRYDGMISTEYVNGVFQSVVTLSFQPIKIK